MPQIHISMREGRSEEAIRTLISRVTAAVTESIDAPASAVRVLITELPATRWADGDVTLAEKIAARDKAAE